jgi:hypothetical protein
MGNLWTTRNKCIYEYICFIYCEFDIFFQVNIEISDDIINEQQLNLYNSSNCQQNPFVQSIPQPNTSLDEPLQSMLVIHIHYIYFYLFLLNLFSSRMHGMKVDILQVVIMH